MRISTETSHFYIDLVFYNYLLKCFVVIILCADKDETMVQYSVLQENEQLFASKYRTVLPTEEELTTELQRERRLVG